MGLYGLEVMPIERAPISEHLLLFLNRPTQRTLFLRSLRSLGVKEFRPGEELSLRLIYSRLSHLSYLTL